MQEQLQAYQITLNGKGSRTNKISLGPRKDLKKMPISEKSLMAWQRLKD
jgi:hypothetical protein